MLFEYILLIALPRLCHDWVLHDFHGDTADEELRYFSEDGLIGIPDGVDEGLQ
jgi:hypothetical protein